MLTSEYGRRVLELFESGRATKAQKAELVGAVLSAFEDGLENVKAIHRGIKFDVKSEAL